MDFLKRPKFVQGCAIAWLLAFAIGFINNYFHVNSRNELRQEVPAHSCSTNGVIADIFPPDYHHNASPGTAFTYLKPVEKNIMDIPSLSIQEEFMTPSLYFIKKRILKRAFT